MASIDWLYSLYRSDIKHLVTPHVLNYIYLSLKIDDSLKFIDNSVFVKQYRDDTKSPTIYNSQLVHHNNCKQV